MEAVSVDSPWSDIDYADLDAGIRRAVRVLREAGVETFESCEGGLGHPENPGGEHAYPEPTVRFHGGDGAGWKALGVLLDHGLPVGALRRTWPLPIQRSDRSLLGSDLHAAAQLTFGHSLHSGLLPVPDTRWAL